MHRYARDLQLVGMAIADLMYSIPGTKSYRVEANALNTAGIAIDRILNAYQKEGIKTFNVSGREIMLAR